LGFANYLNLTTANFDSYGNVSFDPCEFTLHTAANADNNDCSKKLVCFLQHMNMCEKKMVTIRHQILIEYADAITIENLHTQMYQNLKLTLFFLEDPSP
jgi:hypothetical protein